MSLLDQGKISGRQLMALLILIRLVPGLLICPILLTLKNAQDAWIADLLSTLLVIPLVLLMVKLGLKFPQQTIIEYAETLLGPVLGKAIGLVLIGYFLEIAADVARAFGESFTLSLMSKTPILVFIVMLTFLAAYAVRNGLEIIGRAGEGFLIIVCFFLLMLMILPYDLIHWENLKPLLPGGWAPLLRPTGNILSFYAQFIVIGMLIPYLNQPRAATRYALLSVIFSGVITLLMCLALVGVFGPNVNIFAFPSYELAMIISLAEFLEHIEVIIIAAWMLCATIKLALFLWAAAVGIGQLFRLQNFQPLTYPLGAIAVAFSILFYENIVAFVKFYTGAWVGYSLTITLGVLLILYIARIIHKYLGLKGGNQ
jgi:spore germination protein KB